MNVTTHDIQLEAIDALAGVDTVCLFVGEDERPLTGLAGYVDWRLCGSLSRLLQGGFFTGVAGDTVLMPSDARIPAVRIFVVGVGPRGALVAPRVEELLQAAAEMLNRARAEGVAIEPPTAPALDEEGRVQAFKRAFLPGFRGARVAVFADKNIARLLTG